MTHIVTPALVRQYLLATGWTVGERGFLVKSTRQVGLFEAMTAYDIDHEIDKVAHMERSSRSEMAARLGMLAAAEMLIAVAPNAATGGERSTLLVQARHLVEAASVDPEAWEKARGQ